MGAAGTTTRSESVDLEILSSGWSLFDDDWLSQPVPLRQRFFALLVVLLFFVACVPLGAILLFSMALQLVTPKTPLWKNVQATILVTLCLVAEVAWFGALVYWAGTAVMSRIV